MPPKGKKGAAADKAKDLQETEDPLQAVVRLHTTFHHITPVQADFPKVLADSFETRFQPFTLQRPRVRASPALPFGVWLNLLVQCLLPLVNVPLIEYTLEFLAKCGVDEVYVYCGAHTDQIEHYLQ